MRGSETASRFPARASPRGEGGLSVFHNRRKARRRLTGIHAFPLCSESDYRDTVLALVSSFERHGVSFGFASEAHLPSPSRIRTFALAGARSRLRCLDRWPGGAALRGLGRRPILAFSPLRMVLGRTSPVSVPCGTQLSWRPLRDFPVLATAFRIALRLRPTAPLIAARVPLREATACFCPVLPAWPFARPVSRLRSWPCCPHGGDGLATVPFAGCLPPGFRWLDVTISPKFV